MILHNYFYYLSHSIIQMSQPQFFSLNFLHSRYLPVPFQQTCLGKKITLSKNSFLNDNIHMKIWLKIYASYI